MTAEVIALPARRQPPQVEFGDRLRIIRRDMDMGQVEFAEFLGFGRQRYAAWEVGRSKPRDLTQVAEQLELRTGVPRAWFLGWMDQQPNGPTTGGYGLGSGDPEPTQE